MAYFPRIGIELSSDSELLFTDAEMDRPSLIVRFENNFREGRFRTPGPTYNFVVTIRCNETDFNVLMAFIELHGAVTPFTLVHPDYGEGTAFLALAKQKIRKIVRGKPGLRWFELEIPIEAEY